MAIFRLALAALAFVVVQTDITSAQRQDPPATGGSVVNRSRDCHRNVIRHRVLGRMVAHRHTGRNCRIEVVRDRNDRRRHRCIIVDGRRYCRD